MEWFHCRDQWKRMLLQFGNLWIIAGAGNTYFWKYKRRGYLLHRRWRRQRLSRKLSHSVILEENVSLGWNWNRTGDEGTWSWDFGLLREFIRHSSQQLVAVVHRFRENLRNCKANYLTSWIYSFHVLLAICLIRRSAKFEVGGQGWTWRLWTLVGRLLASFSVVEVPELNNAAPALRIWQKESPSWLSFALQKLQTSVSIEPGIIFLEITRLVFWAIRRQSVRNREKSSLLVSYEHILLLLGLIWHCLVIVMYRKSPMDHPSVSFWRASEIIFLLSKRVRGLVHLCQKAQ